MCVFWFGRWRLSRVNNLPDRTTIFLYSGDFMRSHRSGVKFEKCINTHDQHQTPKHTNAIAAGVADANWPIVDRTQARAPVTNDKPLFAHLAGRGHADHRHHHHRAVSVLAMRSQPSRAPGQAAGDRDALIVVHPISIAVFARRIFGSDL